VCTDNFDELKKKTEKDVRESEKVLLFNFHLIFLIVSLTGPTKICCQPPRANFHLIFLIVSLTGPTKICCQPHRADFSTCRTNDHPLQRPVTPERKGKPT
jgi:hypothetical protein